MYLTSLLSLSRKAVVLPLASLPLIPVTAMTFICIIHHTLIFSLLSNFPLSCAHVSLALFGSVDSRVSSENTESKQTSRLESLQVSRIWGILCLKQNYWQNWALIIELNNYWKKCDKITESAKIRVFHGKCRQMTSQSQSGTFSHLQIYFSTIFLIRKK